MLLLLLMPSLSRERAMTTPKTFAQFHYFIVLSLLLPFFAFFFNPQPPEKKNSFHSSLYYDDYKRDQPLEEKAGEVDVENLSLFPFLSSNIGFYICKKKNAKKKRKIYGKYGKSATQI